MIAFVCPGCSKTFKAKDEFAGRTTNCPGCKTRFVVPRPEPTPAPISQPIVAAPSQTKWNTGARVLAHWPNEVSWWYPAKVVQTEGDKIKIRFEDGDESWLSPDQVTHFDISAGTRVHARWKNGPTFFPGIVGEIKGDEVYIRYDDGDEEWSSIQCIRVDRGQPSSSSRTGRGSGKSGSKNPSIYVILGISAAAVVVLVLATCSLALLLLGDGPQTVAKKQMTTAEFEGLVMDKQGHQVIEAVGRPVRTQKLAGNEYWYYDNVASDPISRKRASAQLVFPGDSIGWCQAVNWH